jgi:uncharacterized membrane protein YphA (DoxX/SURF4 family)
VPAAIGVMVVIGMLLRVGALVTIGVVVVIGMLIQVTRACDVMWGVCYVCPSHVGGECHDNRGGGNPIVCVLCQAL